MMRSKEAREAMDAAVDVGVDHAPRRRLDDEGGRLRKPLLRRRCRAVATDDGVELREVVHNRHRGGGAVNDAELARELQALILRHGKAQRGVRGGGSGALRVRHRFGRNRDHRTVVGLDVRQTAVDRPEVTVAERAPAAAVEHDD
eukprot:CAMPEP_0174834812 /NCGR_PEP_ID=MMETSP1114-20130205/5060_1 /TAXON_ID=312471 /ORGANISM="Neobodo designis, Strain CCAP 1951/1" /LENGTH=144 /DNA_ID=CAMNT_0016068741 /DNA_START=175 /DNA_END=608 /DNA_ORIENTATION=+